MKLIDLNLVIGCICLGIGIYDLQTDNLFAGFQIGAAALNFGLFIHTLTDKIKLQMTVQGERQ